MSHLAASVLSVRSADQAQAASIIIAALETIPIRKIPRSLRFLGMTREAVSYTCHFDRREKSFQHTTVNLTDRLFKSF